MKECTKTAFDNSCAGNDFLCGYLLTMDHMFLVSPSIRL